MGTNKIENNENNCKITSDGFMKSGIGFAGFGIGAYFLWPILVAFILFGVVVAFGLMDMVKYAYEKAIVAPYEYIDNKIEPDKYTAKETLLTGFALLQASQRDMADNMGISTIDAAHYKDFKKYLSDDASEMLESKYHISAIDSKNLEIMNPGQDLCRYIKEDVEKNKNFLECKENKLLVKFQNIGK